MKRLLVMVLFVPMMGCSGAGPRSEEPPPTSVSGGMVPAGLAEGDCLREEVAGEGSPVVRIAPCDGSFDHRVVAVIETPEGEGGGYAGEDAVVAAADERCVALFERSMFAGDDRFLPGHITPTEEMWSAGEKDTVCVASAR